jgi:hypothetical protein
MCSTILSSIPIWLKYIYKLLGVIQFSDKPSQKKSVLIIPYMWPLTLYLFYSYVIIWAVLSLKSQEYTVFTSIIKYCDSLGIIASFLNMFTNCFVFYQRTPRLTLLLSQLCKCGGTEKQLNNWIKVYFMILVFTILTFTQFNIFDISPAIQLSYNIPIIINIFELLFVGDILSTLHQKFHVINQELVNEVAVIDKFPQTIAQRICQVQKLSNRHHILVDLAKEANELFSTTTLAAMVTLFATVIDSIYFNLYLYANYNANFVNMFLFFNIIWLAAQVSWFYVLLKIWSDIQDEVKKK